MEGIDSLREAIRSVPIPGAPPRLSHSGAAVGLSFLDTVLRQNHVRRITQRLTLIEHRSARCTTEVDISLGLLDDGQRKAGLYYQTVRNRGDRQENVPGGQESAGPRDNLIWVPVSRVPRRSQAPIDVVGTHGAKLPRLTQYETSWLLASALYRLLRTVLSTEPGANVQENTELSDFLFRKHETRWLVQAALVALLSERRKPAFAWRPWGKPRSIMDGHEAKRRTAALNLLDAYAPTLADYNKLLDLAVNEYLLVVGLDPSRDEHLLVYDTPLHVGEQRRRSLWRPLRLAGGSYYVEYKTQLPSSLRAFHLVAETEPTLQIKSMYMHGDADSGIATELHNDLTTLAPLVEREQRTPPLSASRQLIELELQTCLRRLAELFRRRRWEASQAELELSETALRATHTLARAGTSGGDTLAGRRKYLLDAVTVTTLTKAAQEIRDQELHLDLSMETDPAANRAHVYWRRDTARTNGDKSIVISSSIFLQDTGGTRLGSVIGYVAGVVTISCALGWLMFGSAFPYFSSRPLRDSINAEAIVAVLLLVPGFLYTRLNLPARQSIAGQLRLLPRFVAHITIAAIAALAATIAAGTGPPLIHAAFLACTVLPAFAALLMLIVSDTVQGAFLSAVPRLHGWARSGTRIDDSEGPPQPARAGRRRRTQALYSAPDAVFHTFEPATKSRRSRPARRAPKAGDRP